MYNTKKNECDWLNSLSWLLHNWQLLGHGKHTFQSCINCFISTCYFWILFNFSNSSLSFENSNTCMENEDCITSRYLLYFYIWNPKNFCSIAASFGHYGLHPIIILVKWSNSCSSLNLTFKFPSPCISFFSLNYFHS